MILAVLTLCLFTTPDAQAISVTVEVPKIKARPYHRPYVAVWLETEDRQGKTTLAVWHEQEEWLKDMRQWWRKLGRSKKESYDGVSGATRKPGTYQIHWKAESTEGTPLLPGAYFLNLEAAREQGGRDFIRQKIQLGSSETQEYQIQGDVELGTVTIKIEGVTK